MLLETAGPQAQVRAGGRVTVVVGFVASAASWSLPWQRRRPVLHPGQHSRLRPPVHPSPLKLHKKGHLCTLVPLPAVLPAAAVPALRVARRGRVGGGAVPLARQSPAAGGDSWPGKHGE